MTWRDEEEAWKRLVRVTRILKLFVKKAGVERGKPGYVG